MGHIELAAPVSHIWFFRGVPSRIGSILDITPKALEQVLYYVNYIVINPKESGFNYKQVISDREYRDAVEQLGPKAFEAGMGAEAIKTLLKQINLEEESKHLKATLKTAKGQKKLKTIKRLEIVEAFVKSGNKPEWMVMDALPVLPPDLRPMVQLDGGRFATSDLNDLYRRVINRNNRLKKLVELGAPEVIIRNEKRMLQEAVDALIENGKRGKAIQGPKSRDLKSLTAMLRGKQGRFRQNLLGKRVDYSGRSVIVVGPELKIFQCGLPKEMALELFKPFIMKKLVEQNQSFNIKTAKRIIEREKPVVWDVLDEVIKDHPVLLNRAPTLHRLGIQAFEPVLVEGRAIKLHPLVCAGFNADFDGDQMPVHVPLSLEARTEARMIMLASNNVLKPADGKPIMTPQQDIVIGVYYMTINKEGAKGEGSVFSSEDEAVMAYDTRNVELQSKIFVRKSAEFNKKTVTGRVETSVGRILFNRCIPQDTGIIDRSKKENVLKYEIEGTVGKKELSNIVSLVYDKFGATPTVVMLDKIKELGFRYSTIGAVTINVFDMKEPVEKAQLIAEADAKVAANEAAYRRGLIAYDEKVNKNIAIWNETTNALKDAVVRGLDSLNPIKMMAISGARGNPSQINQLSGMRGIMASTSGQKIDVPVKACFRSGLTPLDYFLSSRGGRKGMADTALKTADSGYLTRRLVDVAQDVVINQDDCFAALGEKPKGMMVTDLMEDGTVIEKLEDRISGRVAVDNIYHAKTKELLVAAGNMILPKVAKEIVNSGIKEVNIRTALTCKSKHGVCAKCYGRNMANNQMVNVGEAVGIIAAQSIGEPGTQLTMRTFHTGGVAATSDITKGLPRVEEIFEARRPKGEGIISEVSGKVKVEESGERFKITVRGADGDIEYMTPPKNKVVIAVKTGDNVEIGQVLTQGSLFPSDILRIRGLKGVQEYILKEVLLVYRLQDVQINTKHVEIIIKQMLRKVKIEDPGSTELLAGDMIDIYAYEDANTKALSKGGMPATAKRVLLGITKASLSTESFLSAASFQETSSVLTEAAIKGKVDPLMGLKENVIIGKIIPAGTGMKRYRDLFPVENKKDNNIYEQTIDMSVASGQNKLFEEE
jgi:DNA-directed RNA polymerase subunit beta'